MNAVPAILIPIAWRNLWRNPRRTVFMLIAVAVALWSIVSFDALMKAWARSTLDASLSELTGAGQIHAPGYLDDPGVRYRMSPPSGQLRTALDGPQVTAWAGRVRVPAVVASERGSFPVTLVGIEPARERGLSFIARAVREGRGLTASDGGGIVLGRKLAQRLKTGLGKRVVLMSQGENGQLAERGFPVVGIYAAAPRTEDEFVFIGLRTAQTMLGIGNTLSEVAFDLAARQGLAPFIARLRRAAPELDIRSWRQLRPLTRAMTQLSDSFVGIWLGVMAVLVVFGVVNTLLMAVYERSREFGLLQALGLRPQLIVLQVALESAMLLALGVAAGAVAAALTVAVFHNGLELAFLARGAEWLGAGRVLYPQLDTAVLMRTGAVVWVIGFLASLWPAWRAARRRPTEGLNAA